MGGTYLSLIIIRFASQLLLIATLARRPLLPQGRQAEATDRNEAEGIKTSLTDIHA
jgi:hypothetical protein